MNKSLLKSIGEEEKEEPILKCPYSGQIISQNLKEKIDKDIEEEALQSPSTQPVICQPTDQITQATDQITHPSLTEEQKEHLE